MTRINVYTEIEHGCGHPERILAGWFDPHAAEQYPEDTDWDGNNHISVMTGSDPPQIRR